MTTKAKNVVQSDVKLAFNNGLKRAKPRATEAGQAVKGKATTIAAALVGVAGTVAGSVTGFARGLWS